MNVNGSCGTSAASQHLLLQVGVLERGQLRPAPRQRRGKALRQRSDVGRKARGRAQPPLVQQLQCHLHVPVEANTSWASGHPRPVVLIRHLRGMALSV